MMSSWVSSCLMAMRSCATIVRAAECSAFHRIDLTGSAGGFTLLPMAVTPRGKERGGAEWRSPSLITLYKVYGLAGFHRSNGPILIENPEPCLDCLGTAPEGPAAPRPAVESAGGSARCAAATSSGGAPHDTPLTITAGGRTPLYQA